MNNLQPPYRIFEEEDLEAAPWTFAQDDEPLRDYLPAWDYVSEFILRRTIRYDLTVLKYGCGLGRQGALGVAVSYWSTGNYIRHTAPCSLLPAGTGKTQIDIEIPLACGGFSGDFTVETCVVLVEPDPSAGVFSPHRPGSVLWRDTHTARLHGAAGIMPTTPLIFSEAGLPSDAAWSLDVDSSRWDAPVLSSLQILLNASNPAISDALAGRLSPEATGILWASLKVDIVLDLLLTAFRDEDFDPDVATHDGDGILTVGGFVVGLIRRDLRGVGEAVGSAFARLKSESEDPPRLRARVQSALGFPRGRG